MVNPSVGSSTSAKKRYYLCLQLNQEAVMSNLTERYQYVIEEFAWHDRYTCIVRWTPKQPAESETDTFQLRQSTQAKPSEDYFPNS